MSHREGGYVADLPPAELRVVRQALSVLSDIWYMTHDNSNTTRGGTMGSGVQGTLAAIGLGNNLLASSDIDEALKTLKDVVGLPSWVISILTLMLALRVLYKPLFEAFSPVYKVVVNYIVPVFYTAERSARVRDRRMFADHLEAEIRRHNGLYATKRGERPRSLAVR
jgi:hypothetical protein